MSERLPKLEFGIHDPKHRHLWLARKRDYVARKWERGGWHLLERIVKVCGLRFPGAVRSSGIEVVLGARSERRQGGSCGWMFPDSPAQIYLFIRRRDSYKSMESALCHELIHSLMWSCKFHDQRRRTTTLFEDFFADELLTTLLEELTIKGSSGKVDVEWALDYARGEAYRRLRDLKRYRASYSRLKTSLMDELALYRRHVRTGRSDALKERRRIVGTLPSPI